MEKIKSDLNRRDFIKTMTFGGLAFLSGCSNESNPSDSANQNTTNPSPSTNIALYKTPDRKEGVKKVLELLDFPPVQDKKVLLKPNFNTADPAPASTHNDTLRQLVIELKDRGASEITLGERSFQRFSDVIRLKEIDKMAAELEFKIENLGEQDYLTRFNQNGLHWSNGFTIPNMVTDAEYFVSTCCLKTHASGGVFTMSLKLAVGLLPSRHMSELHSSPNMRDMIAEINLAYKPDLIVMDGIKTFIAGGPSQGLEADGNVMIAGTDRVAIDAVGVAILRDLGASQITGKFFQQDQIKRAVELGLGISRPNLIKFITPDEPSREYAQKLTSILAEG